LLTTWINLCILPGFVLGLLLVNRWYHVRTQTWGFILCAAGMGILLAAYEFHWPVWIAVSGFMLFELFLNAGPHLMTFIIPPQIYSVAERGAGAGLNPDGLDQLDQDLKKRGLVGVLPLPEQPENKSGVVLIRVTVDASGRVTSAAYEPKGSTTSDVELVAEARKAALRTRFTESRTVIEGGVITYIFKLTAE